VEYFNRMEDENIAQAIPNAQAWDWMKTNIPLFECPQDNFEEIYYFRCGPCGSISNKRRWVMLLPNFWSSAVMPTNTT
jgi:hypothetical protein